MELGEEMSWRIGLRINSNIHIKCITSYSKKKKTINGIFVVNWFFDIGQIKIRWN